MTSTASAEVILCVDGVPHSRHVQLQCVATRDQKDNRCFPVK